MFNNRKRQLLGSLLAGLLCSLGLGASAQAQDKDAKDATAVVSARAPVWTPELGEVPLDKYTRQELSEMVRNYWTPERMRAAIPAPMPSPASVAQESVKNLNYAREEIPEIVLSEPALPQRINKNYKNKNAVAPNYWGANGKIFYHDMISGIDRYCSGAAINSSSRRIAAKQYRVTN